MRSGDHAIRSAAGGKRTCAAPRTGSVSHAPAGRIRVDDRGQAAVEVAMAMPLVVVLVLGVLQVALVGRDQLAVELAAREAARAASVSADPARAATAAAARVTGLHPLDVTVAVGGDVVRVTVRYVNPTDVAIIGPLIGDAPITATAVMALEPPP